MGAEAPTRGTPPRANAFSGAGSWPRIRALATVDTRLGTSRKSAAGCHALGPGKLAGGPDGATDHVA